MVLGFSENRYKDAVPLATINRIKDILGDLGLLPIERLWRNTVEGYYSVMLELAGTDLSTNGKGVSPEYALASAYGEMMERLQNQCTFRLSFDFRQEALAYRGFFYAPDEKRLNAEDLLNSKEDWMVWQWNHAAGDIDRRELLALWQQVTYEELPADFIVLPYFNLAQRTVSHIPVKMAAKMYMSNGMCAGNSAQEAIVQGISEILERYVNRRILREHLVPPNVPREYIAQYPELLAMIESLEASGNYEIIVKDCSLGEGFPVVGVIYSDRSTQAYFVKFGAHPLFEVALERTLTELLQGQDIHKMMGTREFCYYDAAHDPANLIGILVNGSGIYPSVFFGPEESYPFQGFAAVPARSNGELLGSLLELLTAKGFEVYVRDVSFLGFPSYHVVIPGLSEIDRFDDIGEILEYGAYNKARRLLRKLDRLTEGETKGLEAFLQKLPHGPDSHVTDFLNLPFKRPTAPWYYTSIDLLMTVLACRRGDLAAAHAAFERFADYSKIGPFPASAKTYYRCVRDYLGARADGLSDAATLKLLSVFYPMDVVGGVVAEFGTPQDILDNQPPLSCWDCRQCRYAEGCLYPAMERVYLAFKDRYAACNIDQIRLGDLL